ncbi:hypothetical protein CYLTODRAFT_488046 [Cylindrobasidium torrendii FP15055 ss-10]|uniref:Uncharacterized protein n=1 Tax=Cylindrobasidium torrendii FP15055 ss-10 TaxID=1314674 RepID=A0A0D7BJT6_9AGAR|nr:hypothetical protein CYLTODRAFT_488046 [Cylindrobasidium torrendii FP15055 ss-10]
MGKKARRKLADGIDTASPSVETKTKAKKKKKHKTNIRTPDDSEDDNSVFADAPADAVQDSLVKTGKSSKKKKKSKKSKKGKKEKAAAVEVRSDCSTDEEESKSGGNSDVDNSGTYKPRDEHMSKSEEVPHVRTHKELQGHIPASSLRLLKQWSYKPGRSVDNNVLLRIGTGENSHIFGRNSDPFLILQRISEEAGVVADVDSWLNMYLRDLESHNCVDHDLEADCPSFQDAQAFIEHCKQNALLVTKGKQPISLAEVKGYEIGTIFTYQVVNFGRSGPVFLFINEDGSDSDTVAPWQLLLTDKTFFRKHHAHGYLNYTISAYLCKLRRRMIKDYDFLSNGCLNGEALDASIALWNFAQIQGWFRPATEGEIQRLVRDGVLKSATCRKADMFRGIKVPKKNGKMSKREPFFTLKNPSLQHTAPAPEPVQLPKARTLADIRAAARPVTPTQKRPRHAPESPPSGADSPPRPAKKRVRHEPEIRPGIVTRLPERVQRLSSDRPIRPPLERVRIGSEYKWILPEWWTKNIPANAHAPVELCIANSLYPRQTVAHSENDPPDNAVAGPGPSTIAAMTLRNGKKAKA